MNRSPDDELGVKAKVHLIYTETTKIQSFSFFSFPISSASGFEVIVSIEGVFG